MSMEKETVAHSDPLHQPSKQEIIATLSFRSLQQKINKKYI